MTYSMSIRYAQGFLPCAMKISRKKPSPSVWLNVWRFGCGWILARWKGCLVVRPVLYFDYDHVVEDASLTNTVIKRAGGLPENLVEVQWDSVWCKLVGGISVRIDNRDKTRLKNRPKSIKTYTDTVIHEPIKLILHNSN